MTKQSISIAGKETKKHIAEALKLVFPGVKFSYRSDFNSVTLYWVDGPLVPDVDKVLNRFTSYTRVLAHTDYTDSTGYEWKGELYVGARYLSTVRSLSEQRKGAIIEYMDSIDGSSYANALKFERVDAERHLIASGILEGKTPADRPDLMLDESPTRDERRPARVEPVKLPDNVVQLFPKKTDEQQWLDSLTPEQRLKLQALISFFRLEAADLLLREDVTIDDAFALAANEFYGKK
ncbi:LPD29 domain-containing protein [Bacillus sp. FJAT-28004]|uniref:LPD29 domain-containing protein n=1 Tax=Bacillus sp. FJAT-28004 TaxID=1679165 RepID=UPI0006B4AC90|nr:LPD29 domain-containing protein [Bacillus sp. FJAT-28004]